MADSPHTAAAAVAASHRPVSHRRVTHFLRQMPMFAFVLLAHTVIVALVDNTRAELFSFFGYALTWVEIIYLLAITTAMLELNKVSKPSIDNTKEAMLMVLVSGVALVLFTLGANGVEFLSVYANTEFLVVLAISILQSAMAISINARTLKRTFDGGFHED